MIEKKLVSNNVEEKLKIDERELGLRDVHFNTFLYTIKRYGFSEATYTHDILAKVSHHINIKAEEFDNEKDEDAKKDICLAFKSEYIFDRAKGSYDVKKLIALGFLYCNHPDPHQKREELWTLINSEANETVTKEQVRQIMHMLFYYAIDLRLLIERSRRVTDQRKDVINYLESADQDINALIALKILSKLPADEGLTEK